MDGVIANFFEEYAKLAGVKSYRDVPAAKVDPTLNKMIGTNFFDKLPKFPVSDKIVNICVQAAGSYGIISSPLRNDFANSEKQKRNWIKRELNPQPVEIFITPNKAKHAVSDGVPNVLIDDRGDNISSWEAAGGIGIKFQADEDSLKVILDGLKRARRIGDGDDKLVPQELKSRNLGSMIATDKDDETKENFADGKVKGKSRPGRVKRSGASCNGSVTDLRKRAKNASGEKAKMYHWCANMKSGKK